MTGEELKRIRKDRGLTRQEMGEALGVSPHAIEKWEQGVNAVPKFVDTALMSSVKATVDVEDLAFVVELAKTRGETVDETINYLIRLGIRGAAGDVQ